MICWIKRKRHAWINGNLLKSLIYMCLFFLIDTGSCGRAVLSNKLEGVTVPCSARCVMSLCSDLLISAKLKWGCPPHRRLQGCGMQIQMPFGGLRLLVAAEGGCLLAWSCFYTERKPLGNCCPQTRHCQRSLFQDWWHLGALPGRVALLSCHSLDFPQDILESCTTAPQIHSKMITVLLNPGNWIFLSAN